MVVTLEYLIKLQYQGDQHMSVFKQTWLECIDRMRPEDVPSDNAMYRLTMRCAILYIRRSRFAGSQDGAPRLLRHAQL